MKSKKAAPKVKAKKAAPKAKAKKAAPKAKASKPVKKPVKKPKPEPAYDHLFAKLRDIESKINALEKQS